MDREQAKAMAAARGGSFAPHSAQSTAVDARALAKARATVAANALRSTSIGLDAASHRALAAKYKARKGA
jgi:hypothetical protein